MALRLLALVLAVAASGCIDTGPRFEAKTLQDIDAVLDARQAAVKDLNAEIGMTMEGLEKSGSCAGVLLYQPPDRLRLEAFPRMGPPLFSFACVGDVTKLYINGSNKFLIGSLAANSRRHPEMVAAFAWMAEHREPGDERVLEEDAADHAVILTRRNGVPVRRTRLERPTLFVTQVLVYAPDGSISSTIDMSGYQEAKPPAAFPGPSTWLPGRIVIGGRTEEGRAYELKIKLNIVYLNEGLEPGVFDMQPPEGAVVEEQK